MSRTIKRGGKGVRRSAATRKQARRVTSAKRKTGGAVDALAKWLPFDEEALQRIFLALILGAAAALAWMVASLAGVPAMADRQIAVLASDAGFEVRRIEVRGVDRMNELTVYERVLGEEDRAMPQVDLAQVREDLLELSWVRDARVSRQLPDTLVVDIVERRPHAVLAKADRFVLIDADGHELEPIREADTKGMLVVSGPGAARQMPDLAQLLDSAPALRPQVRAAEWVGNRRWDVTFRTGQVLALPQGREESAEALTKFARIDGRNRLIGGKVASFDMRAEGRLYMRIPGRSEEMVDTGSGEGG